MADIQRQIAERAQARHRRPAPTRVGDVVLDGEPIPDDVIGLGAWRLTAAGHWHMPTAQATCPTGCGADGRWLMRKAARLVVTAVREPEHQPARGDAVAVWLRGRRDTYARDTAEWTALDFVLDDYRLHADVGEPLSTPTDSLGPYAERP